MGNIGLIFTKLFFICTSAVICEIICENTAAKDSVKTVCSLCVCAAVFSCFIPFGNNFPDILSELSALSETTDIQSFDTAQSRVIDSTKKELENRLAKYISDNFGIKPQAVGIQFSIISSGNEKSVSVESANIILPNNVADENVFAVKNAVQMLLGCDIKVHKHTD